MSGHGTVVIGATHGDEGKGKVIEFLEDAEEYSAIAKYHGADNAANTSFINGKKIISRLVPIGTVKPGMIGIDGNGVAINPPGLINEISALKEQGFDIDEDKFKLSPECAVIMPYHKIRDVLEDLMKMRGTTGSGVGPVHIDKAGRDDIKIKDLLDPEILRQKIEKNKEIIEIMITYFLSTKKLSDDKLAKRFDLLKKDFFSFYDYEIKDSDPLLSNLYSISKNKLDGKGMKLDMIVEEYHKCGQTLAKYLTDTRVLINTLLDCNENVLFQGAHGMGLDVEWGDDYYKTCSHCGVAGAINGTGVNFRYLKDVYIVTKAVPSRVGRGPFMTAYRQFDDIDQNEKDISLKNLVLLKEKINAGKATDSQIGLYFTKLTGEKGSMSGRIRAVGRLDLPAVKKSIELNGANHLAITKIDALFGIGKIEVCVDYEEKVGQIIPIYEKWEGFSTIKDPVMEKYLRKIENYLGIPVTIASYGPGHDETIHRK